MEKIKKYGLMTYEDTNNIGDEIQSLAAERFLPKIDKFVHREKLNFYKGPKIKMILNGWFMEYPNNWPPSEKIKPLFISFHINDKSQECMNSKKSIEYFKKHEPIGCRDHTTKDFLLKNKVNAYFSGCLTLTLKKKGFKKNNKIVFVDIDNDVVRDFKKKYGDRVEEYTHWACSIKEKRIKKFLKKYKIINKFKDSKLGNIIKKIFFWEKLDTKQKFEQAKKMLEIYEKAKLVITERIHVALPCLALKTPVIFVIKDKHDSRFKGILELFNTISVEKLRKEKSSLNLEDYKKNPNKYKKLRKNNIEKCKNFINGE